ncbi:MAG TPA: PAS domain-containing protein [Egibacteraceae bacterium]|nr:PAS domain-containing protein [Egibacteraceae bacterium]
MVTVKEAGWLLEQLPVGAVLAAPDGSVHEANGAAQALGLAPQDAPGLDPWWRELTHKARVTGGAVEDEIVREVEGEARVLHVRAALVAAGGGGDRIVATFEDITERRSLELDALTLRNQIAAIETLASVGTYSRDLPGEEIVASEGMYRIFGLDPQRPFTWEIVQERTHPDDRGRMVSEFLEAMEKGTTPGCEYRCIMPDGTLKWRKGWGRLVFGPDGPVRVYGVNQDITERKLREEALAESLAVSTSLAAENEALHAEVKAQLAEVVASRARIVEAADAERRRVERNLHDGAQQRLVSLALALRLAQAHLDSGMEADARATLAKASEELATALSELRELAQGIHPAILTEEGLGAALSSLAIRAPIPTTVVAVPPGRLPTAVEEAAYYVVCEAVTNAAKHSRASAVTIDVGYDGTQVAAEVVDDGVGGASLRAGSGLRGLVDRLSVLEGHLEVTNAPGGGTRVRATIPCPLT